MEIVEESPIKASNSKMHMHTHTHIFTHGYACYSYASMYKKCNTHTHAFQKKGINAHSEIESSNVFFCSLSADGEKP